MATFWSLCGHFRVTFGSLLGPKRAVNVKEMCSTYTPFTPPFLRVRDPGTRATIAQCRTVHSTVRAALCSAHVGPPWGLGRAVAVRSRHASCRPRTALCGPLTRRRGPWGRLVVTSLSPKFRLCPRVITLPRDGGQTATYRRRSSAHNHPCPPGGTSFCGPFEARVPGFSPASPHLVPQKPVVAPSRSPRYRPGK